MSEKVTRRTFFERGTKKTAAIVAGTSIVGFAAVKGYEALTAPRETTEEIFAREGVSDLLPFFLSASAILKKYHTTPIYSLFGYGTTEPFGLLSKLSRGSLKEWESEAIKNGWGSEIDHTKQKATNKIARVKIYFEDGVTGEIEDARQFLRSFAEVLPYHILIAPDTFKITRGGGTYNGVWRDTLTNNPKEPEITVGLPTINPDKENPYVSLAHEVGHAEVNWINGKPFVTMSGWGEYQRLRTETIMDTLDLYYSLDWSEARRFNGDGPLRPGGEPDLDRTRMQEAQILERYGIKVDDEDIQDRGVRYARLAHAMGKFQNQVFEKNQAKENGKNVTLTEQEERILKYGGIDSFYLTGKVLKELDHYFVGPVQRTEGGLAKAGDIAGLNTPLGKANLVIQQARLQAFSAIPKDELDTPEKAAVALGKHLLKKAA